MGKQLINKIKLKKIKVKIKKNNKIKINKNKNKRNKNNSTVLTCGGSHMHDNRYKCRSCSGLTVSMVLAN